MTVPRRIQLRRTKGWRLPPETVSVTRPGKWGNPFKVGKWFRPSQGQPSHSHFTMAWEERDGSAEGFTRIEDHAMAVEWFTRFVSHDGQRLNELRGKNLACWCPCEGPCHADVLLKISNSK